MHVDHRRAALALPGRDVGEAGIAVDPEAAVLVDVTEEVEPRTPRADCLEEIYAAGSFAIGRVVAESSRRSVRHQDVQAVRDPRPLFAQRCAPRQVEGPAVELRLPRRAPEAHPVELDAVVFQ